MPESQVTPTGSPPNGIPGAPIPYRASCRLCPWVSDTLPGDDEAAQALFAHSDEAHAMPCAGGVLEPAPAQ